MEIRINGRAADIHADTEKTVGEVLAGMEQWLADSGFRLSGLVVDGEIIGSDSMEEVFKIEIDTLKVLDIQALQLSELAAESLLRIRADIAAYESSDFGEKRAFFENWKTTPQAMFASEQMPDLFELCVRTFSDDSVSSQTLLAVAEERLREIEDPAGEFAILEPLVNETCSRLVDLPLDIQTGKDGQAAQTIQIFSGVAEKIFRILRLFKQQDRITPAVDIISGFSGAIGELLAAYEKRDTVMVGDLAEYEVAPRLRELFTAIMKNTETEIYRE
ncbi:MAG: hypothetical protein LBG91_03380 [Treponema sp.]|jgi:hypothetical protein|nr:hypothetical protein [Treponema sp.]